MRVLANPSQLYRNIARMGNTQGLTWYVGNFLPRPARSVSAATKMSVQINLAECKTPWFIK